MLTLQVGAKFESENEEELKDQMDFTKVVQVAPHLGELVQVAPHLGKLVQVVPHLGELVQMAPT